MDSDKAASLLKAKGYEIISISLIPEGRSHDVFDASLAGGRSVIARFEKPSQNRQPRRDFQYNGLISLERENYLCSLVRETAGLPAPKIESLFVVDDQKFAVAEKLPGKHWKSFLEEKNYSQQVYVSSLELLGADIAQAQRVRFDSFGDIMMDSVIEPAGVTNFALRLGSLLQLKIDREEKTNALSPRELFEVKQYFVDQLNCLYPPLEKTKLASHLILTDLHPMNYLVDDSGKPSGYFDLEFCQAGHPALEIYYLGLQLFNYFNPENATLAQDAFYRGYRENGGQYDPLDVTNRKLETVLSAGQTLTAVTAYHGVKDGVRDTWSTQFKEILFDAISSDTMDTAAYAGVIRQKTRQPTQPSLP